MWLKFLTRTRYLVNYPIVSVLYREPMWLKFVEVAQEALKEGVSVLYREPMWLKYNRLRRALLARDGFSALP